MLPMADASDGFGSIRAPAAACGLVGLRPTRARNTMAPALGEGMGGLSIEHAVTLSVRDCAALLDATSGPGPGDPYVAPPPARPFLAEVGADPGRLRIAVTTTPPNGAPVAVDYLRVLRETADLCTELGHEVHDADPAIERDLVIATFRTLSAVNVLNALQSHPENRDPTPDEVETVIYATMQLAKTIDAASYMRATQAAHRLGRQMAAFHDDYDVLLNPGTRHPAAETRLDRHDDGRSGRILGAGIPLQPVHGVVQSDRSASDDDSAGPDRIRLSDCRAGRRALRR
jgi:Asp-tRNA(Asn)/Glu-tRNA(Gln) amidotransferase A subunit family amidase